MDLLPFFQPDNDTDFPPPTNSDMFDYNWTEECLLDPRSDNAHILPAMRIFSLTIYTITLLLGATGNGLVIYLTGFHMKKTVTTIWYLNLAVADFIFALCLSTEIAYVSLGYRWTLGRLMCKLNTMVPLLNMFASVFFLTAISADRYAAVVHPVWALNHRSLQLASLVAVFIWVAALALSIPYFSFRDTEELMDGTIHCIYSFHLQDEGSLRTHRLMVLAEFVLGFLIPFGIILACYCAIMIKLRGKIFGQFGRSFKIIVAVVMAFFFCWFPHHLFSILETLEDDSLQMQTTLDIGTPLAEGLVCLNSCLNPILYVFVGSDYKKTSRRSLFLAFKGAVNDKWAFTPSFPSNRTSSSTSGVESSMV